MVKYHPYTGVYVCVFVCVHMCVCDFIVDVNLLVKTAMTSASAQLSIKKFS